MSRRPSLRRAALGVVLALALATASACSSSSEEPSSSHAERTPVGVPTPVPGFDGVTIRLGVLTAVTGPEAYIGFPLTAGTKAYFDYVNTELGGIGGKYKVELDSQDVGDGASAVPDAYAAVKDDTVMIASAVGTAAVSSLLPDLRDDGGLAVPALVDVTTDPNLLPVGVPVGVEAINALQWYVTQHGTADEVCSLVQDDGYGRAGADGLAAAAKALRVELGPSAALPAPPAEGGDLSPKIRELADAECDAVVLIATPSTATAALTQSAAASFAPQWIGLSASWTSTLATSPIASYLADHLSVLTSGPAYGDRDVDGMVELVRIKAAYAPATAPDPWFTVGFVQAAAVTALLDEAVARSDLSHAGILAASTALKVTVKGLLAPMTYGPAGRRSLPTTSTVSKVDPAQLDGLAVVAAKVEAPLARTYLRS
jgi:branched-chain amino acid transport system substrate-binding protein